MRNFTFGGNEYAINVNGRHIMVFLEDVKTIVGENAQYEREQTELRRANEHFSAEHVRLSERIAALDAQLHNANEQIADQERRLSNQSISIGNYQKAMSDRDEQIVRMIESMGALESANRELSERMDRANNACVTWEQRHTNVKAKLEAKDQLLNAAGRDLEALRERATGFQEELSAALKERDAVKQALVCEQTKSGNLKESCDRMVMARENQCNTIIGVQQRAAAFDAECTRLRIEVANERNERRQEAANSAREIALLRETNESFATAHTANYERESGNARTYLETIIALRDTVVRLEGALESVDTNFKLADAALSARNEELAIANAALNDVREELGRCTVPRPGSFKIEFNRDGSIVLDTGDGPVTINGKVDMNGNLQTSGALSS